MADSGRQKALGSYGVFVKDRARFSGVTLPADWMILPRMDERALIRAAYITLRRVILERLPPGAKRRAWLRWLLT
jgi:hypothetical protein